MRRVFKYPLKFIDTFQMSGGNLIFHIFEIIGE